MTAATLTLTEFVERRLAEDEAAAHLRDVQTFGTEQRRYSRGDQGPFDPARVLAQVAALREIVRLHTEEDPNDCPPWGRRPDGSEPCWTLSALAQIWAGSEEFDPAWAVGA